MACAEDFISKALGGLKLDLDSYALKGLYEYALVSMQNWSGEKKFNVIGWLVALFALALIYKHSDKAIEAITSYGSRVGFKEMTFGEKSTFIANILQLIPVAGSMGAGAFGAEENKTLQYFFNGVDNIADLLQSAAGAKSLISMLMSARG
jgi:hypothetical protein